MEDLKGELSRVKEDVAEVDKAWVAKRTTLQADKDTLQTEKAAMQVRCEELERAKLDEAKRASKALDQAKRNAETCKEWVSQGSF
ncbi:hypothetical protein LIER_04033 [Lithospermum erythrorhizon]|uniref:Uncharacterized protein n=1 Tax=Lithospermum erythrorhizon TaxID=34254 RepID=A0AAV3NWG9_LITER